jgi:hypothetical protein
MATQAYHKRDTEVTSRMRRYVLTLARWLAKKAFKAEWKAMGRRPERTEASEIAQATNGNLEEFLLGAICVG